MDIPALLIILGILGGIGLVLWNWTHPHAPPR
jgi:hypothetical protein